VSSDRDVTRIVRSWLDEGVNVLPDRVLDLVLDQIPATPQRRAGWLARRFPVMNNTFVRFGIAAAAVLLAALIGFQFLSPNVGTPQPTPSASPSSSAATAASPWSLLDASEDIYLLPAGDYYLDLPTYPARIDFALPDGWWYYSSGTTREASDAHAILVDSLDTGAANGSGWGVSFTLVAEVFADPCNPSGGSMDASVTESADALATAFGTWPDFPATVEDVTVGGFSGTRVEITRAETATCLRAAAFSTPAGYRFEMQGPSSLPVADQFTFLDVDGSVLVIWTTDFSATSPFEVAGGASPDPDAHVGDQVELRSILDSIVITPR
jgi:hypothetical protein